jgi:hypothetical protein
VDRDISSRKPNDRNAITTRTQLGAQPIGVLSAATVGNIVRYNDARTARRLRSAAALGVVCCVLVIGGEWGFLWSDAPSPHAHHAVAAAPIADFAVVTEHPHLRDGSTPASPEIFTAAVLPRVTTALIALGLIASVVCLACSCGRGALPTMRGPPRALAPVLTGQQTLARFCVSRR